VENPFTSGVIVTGWSFTDREEDLAAPRKKDLVGSTTEGCAIPDRFLAAWIPRYRSGPEPVALPHR
jgi:hypothetical protein